MARIIKSLFILALLGLQACVLPKDIERLEAQNAKTRSELLEFQKGFDSRLKDTQKEIEALKIQVTSIDLRLSEDLKKLRRDVYAELTLREKAAGEKEDIKLDGRLTEAREKVEQVQKDLNLLQSRIDEEIYKIKKELTPEFKSQKEAVAVLEGSIGSLKEEVARLNNRLDILAKHLGLDELFSAEPKEGKEKTPSDALYREARSLFEQKNFTLALAKFKEYLETYPKTELSDNALFWMGECYFNLKDFNQAVLAYEKVLKDYPQSDKVPSALLKEGMAFREIGDKTSAQLLFKKLIKGYPNTQQAKIAQKLLAGLK